jgi:hypothetical protein
VKIKSSCIVFVLALLVSACTSGRLEYFTAEGERKYACETEYTWQPSVDKYAVEYVLAHCAQEAVSRGYTVEDTALLEKDLSVPLPPEGSEWSHELAKQHHAKGMLIDKEYGYLIAYLDLGHDSD